MTALRVTGNALVALALYYVTVLGLYGGKDVGKYTRAVTAQVTPVSAGAQPFSTSAPAMRDLYTKTVGGKV